MPDISGAAISGSLKVGLQVVSSYKRPVLEVYHQFCNRIGPEIELNGPPSADGERTEKIKHRFGRVFVQFTLVNIGGVRAEDVEIRIAGPLAKAHPSGDLGSWAGKSFPQFAPGQTHFLFLFREHDLYRYPDGGGRMLGLKDESCTITISYSAPKGVLNWLLALPSRVRGKRRFTTTYTFWPKFIAGDFPPPEYAA